VLHVTSADEAQFVVVETLTPYIFRLSRDYPDSAAEAFVEKLMLMEKNLTKGVAKGPLTASSKTFPGLSELTLLRLAGLIWSTSDMKHRVIGPARMLMGAYLELGRIRSLQDIASGLFVCSLWMQVNVILSLFVIVLMILVRITFKPSHSRVCQLLADVPAGIGAHFLYSSIRPAIHGLCS
jgi:nucleolar protein 14